MESVNSLQHKKKLYWTGPQGQLSSLSRIPILGKIMVRDCACEEKCMDQEAPCLHRRTKVLGALSPAPRADIYYSEGVDFARDPF